MPRGAPMYFVPPQGRPSIMNPVGVRLVTPTLVYQVDYSPFYCLIWRVTRISSEYSVLFIYLSTNTHTHAYMHLTYAYTQ